MQHPFAGLRILEGADLIKHEIDTRRNNQAVIRQILDFLQLDRFLVDIDLGDFIVDHLHTVFAQAGVTHRQIFDSATAAEHEVR